MTLALTILAYLTATFVLAASALALLFPRRPLLGVPQHWGLQLWQLALIALISGFLLLDWLVIGLSGAAVAYWSWRLWPREPPKDSAESAPLLRLASANLLYQNTDHDRILDGIAEIGADVLVLCEATMEARQRLRALEGPLPHALDTCAPESVYGIVILSRFPLTLRSRGNGEDGPLPRHLVADLAVDGRAITLVTIHPTNPLRLSHRHRIPAEFDAVAALCREAPADLILVGDCNAAGWSSYLRGLERIANVANDGRVRPSWPVWLPQSLRLPLDHIWVRGRVVLRRAALGPAFGSDHLPLIAELGWRGK